MKVLIVEDEMVSREKLRLIMAHFGEVVAVQTGCEAVDAFNTALEQGEPYGLVMLDIHMPEKDGLQVLLEMRAKETELKFARKNQAIILMVTAQTDKSRIVSCVQAGCDSYIAKPFNLQVIREKLAKFGVHKQAAKPGDSGQTPHAAGAKSAGELFADATACLNRGDIHLPTLPRIHPKFKALSKAGAPFGQIADLLRKDLALCAELIRLSNSTYYRGFVENKSLDQAVSRLGFAATEKVIEDICGRKLYSMTRKKYRRIIEQLLQHSLACAFSCEAIAKAKKLELEVDPFALGLLHDIGKLGFLQVIAELENKGRFDSDIGTEQVINYLNGYHELFGSQLLEYWKYPDPYVQTVLYHNSLDQAESLTAALGLVHLGNEMANKLGFVLEPANGDGVEESTGDFLNGLKPDAGTLQNIKNAAKDYMTASMELF